MNISLFFGGGGFYLLYFYDFQSTSLYEMLPINLFVIGKEVLNKILQSNLCTHILTILKLHKPRKTSNCRKSKEHLDVILHI